MYQQGGPIDYEIAMTIAKFIASIEWKTHKPRRRLLPGFIRMLIRGWRPEPQDELAVTPAHKVEQGDWS